MKSIDILELVGQTPDRYLLDVENADVSKPSVHTPKRIWLIAAVIAAMVFLMGCAWVVLRMENLKIGSEQATVPVYEVVGNDFTFMENQEISSEILTVSGLNGSPNYQAAREWLEFKQSYDPNHAIMNSLWGNYPEFPAKYDAYDPYSQAMVDKLDEITEKYDLKLLGEKAGFEPDKIHLLPEALGIECFLNESSGAGLKLFAGNCYAGGNFQIGIQLDMPRTEEQWPHTIAGDITYCRNDYFSCDYIALNEDYQWEEWNYTTASGWNVLMIRSESHFHGWIICQRENDIITVKIETSRDSYSETGGEVSEEREIMTRRQMELVADAIDFGMQPTQPDMDWVKAKLED